MIISQALDKKIETRITQLINLLGSIQILSDNVNPYQINECIIPSLRDNLISKNNSHNSKEKKFGFIDLFAGAGGLSLGLEQVGFMPNIVVDNYVAANTTYLFNRPFLDDSKIISEDIRKIDVTKFPHGSTLSRF